jgi:3-hydroxyacyl-[acyl-carrier-protein] dehydratase
MLEAMVQAGAWLMRLSEGFSPPVIVLREARAVRYGSVVKPGDELRVEVELVHGGGGEAAFKGIGRTGDRNAVLGRFVLRRVPLARLGPGLERTDEAIARLLEERLPSLMECGRGL